MVEQHVPGRVKSIGKTGLGKALFQPSIFHINRKWTMSGSFYKDMQLVLEETKPSHRV